MKLKDVWHLIKESVTAWSDDYASSMGAALSYYTVFSIAPLLLIVIAVAGLAFGREAAQGEIAGQLSGLIGDEGAAAVQSLVKSVSEPAKGIIATVVGVVTLVIGATTVFAELQSAMDRIWRSPAPQGSGLWHLLRTRLLSFGVVLGLAFLLLVSLIASAVLAALGSWLGSAFGGEAALLQLLNFVVSFVVITGMFAMIYKLLPRVKIAWRDVWVGAAVTALLFVIGKSLIGLYLGKSGVTSGFGAAGSLVVLLVWVYYSAQIFLLGAEFTWVYAHRHGSRHGSKIGAVTPEAAPRVPDQGKHAAAPQPSAEALPAMQKLAPAPHMQAVAARVASVAGAAEPMTQPRAAAGLQTPARQTPAGQTQAGQTQAGQTQVGQTQAGLTQAVRTRAPGRPAGTKAFIKRHPVQVFVAAIAAMVLGGGLLRSSFRFGQANRRLR